MAEVRFATGILLPEERKYYGGDLSRIIQRFAPLVQTLAVQLDDRDWAFTGAEYEDLYQVGMEAVTRSVGRNIPPSAEYIGLYMRDYCNQLRRQRSLETDSAEDIHHWNEDGEPVTFYEQYGYEQWLLSESDE